MVDTLSPLSDSTRFPVAPLSVAWLRGFAAPPGMVISRFTPSFARAERATSRSMTWRWDQMIREGNATPAWLANDFNANRRHRAVR
ncbi:Transposase Tn3 family protein [Mesorhizobium loti]|nr:Transposase Tn3 family protein [Mesorhizobium loti]